MGLIKLAIIATAGIYAVKKLTKGPQHPSEGVRENANGYPRDDATYSFKGCRRGISPSAPVPQQSMQREWHDEKEFAPRGGNSADAFADLSSQQQQQIYHPVEHPDVKIAYDAEGWQYRVDDRKSGIPPAYRGDGRD